MTDGWLQSRANEVRLVPVLFERRLWTILRNRRLEGLKFLRQQVMGRFIVDFVCRRRRLIVEADGPQHEGRIADVERDDWLRSEGFRLLRFPNSQIENRPHEVLATILSAANRRLA